MGYKKCSRQRDQLCSSLEGKENTILPENCKCYNLRVSICMWRGGVAGAVDGGGGSGRIGEGRGGSQKSSGEK